MVNFLGLLIAPIMEEGIIFRQFPVQFVNENVAEMDTSGKGMVLCKNRCGLF